MIALLVGALSWTLACPGDATAEETVSPPSTEQARMPVKRPDGAIRNATLRVLADPVFGPKVEDMSLARAPTGTGGEGG